MAAGNWVCARCDTVNGRDGPVCSTCGGAPDSIALMVPDPPASDRWTWEPDSDKKEQPATAKGLLRAVLIVAGDMGARLRDRGRRAALTAMAWPAFGLPIVTWAVALTMTDGTLLPWLAIGLLGPLVLGIGTGIAIPGTGGFGFGVLGSLAGAFVSGVGLWIGGVASDRARLEQPSGALAGLGFAAGTAVLVTMLTLAPFGIGVIVGSVAGGLRRGRG